MDNEPKPSNILEPYRFEMLDNADFLKEIKILEQKLNSPFLDEMDFMLLVKDIVEELDELFDEVYTEYPVSVIGEAYFVDEDCELTGKTDIIAEDCIMFDGFSVVKDLSIYEIVFKFTDVLIDDAVNNADPPVVVYYIPVDKILKFIQQKEAPINNDYLGCRLASHANESEAVVNEPEFTDADLNTQLQILKDLAEMTGYEIMAELGDGQVSIETDEFIVVKDNTTYTIVDQSTLLPNQKKILRGTPEGCTFIELIRVHDQKLNQLEYEYPSIKLVDRTTGDTYLIPIRQFRAAHLITDTTK